MGYNNQTEYITTSLTLSNSGTTTTSSSTTVSQEAKGLGDEWYTADTDLVTVATGSLIAYSVSDKTTATAYWLASRYYYYDSSTYYYWCLHYVYSSGRIERHLLYGYSSGGYNSYSHDKTLRPIVTLKSDIKVTSGDGKSEETAYVLD
jgi:hypothetical protein